MKNREIKFRAWDSEKKYMINQTGSEPWFCDEENTLVFQMDNIMGDHDDGTRFKLMQYIGLKDKNGKEVYEGDILNTIEKDSQGEYEFNHVIVKYNLEYSGYSCDSAVSLYEGLYPTYDEPLFVIGNIYENPELLK